MSANNLFIAMFSTIRFPKFQCVVDNHANYASQHRWSLIRLEIRPWTMKTSDKYNNIGNKLGARPHGI